MQEYFLARKCKQPACGLRFTCLQNDPKSERCPVCRSPSEPAGPPYEQHAIPWFAPPATAPRVAVLLDNIRSAWNVGSMLRVADGAGIETVHLCGVSPLPNQGKVEKTALGAELSTAWLYHRDGVEAAVGLAGEGYRLWALEGGAEAVNLFEIPVPSDRPILLVVGNERTGVDPGILDLCERRVCLPMLGSKGSLNVSVAFSAAVYALRFGCQRK